MKYKLENKNGIEFYSVPHLREIQLLQLEMLKLIDKVAAEENIDYWIDGGTLLGAVRHGGFIPWDDDIDICLLKNDYDKLIPLLAERLKDDLKYGLMYYNNKYGIIFWAEYLIHKGVISAHDGIKSNLRVDILPIKLVEDTDAAKEKDKHVVNEAGYFTYGKVKYFPEVISKYNFKSLKYALQEKKEFFDFFVNDYLNKNSETADLSSFLLNYPYNDVNISREREYYKFTDVFPLKKVSFEGYDFPAPRKTDEYLRILYGDYNQLPPLSVRKPFHSTFITNHKVTDDVNSKFIKYKNEYFYLSQKKYFKFLSLFRQIKGNGFVNTYNDIIKPFVQRGFKFK